MQSPYEGPFRVLNRFEKYFVLNIKEKSVNVNLNRLKPCFVVNDELENNTSHIEPSNTDDNNHNVNSHSKKKVRFNFDNSSVKTTKSGRIIKSPERLSY